uniref:L-type lectin-like domain-containing protein n=1 Tax=Octactis speculum TaxID=3111310 RepID=A0A7S2D3Y1_9STRA|mmetsp:Transcript_42444/g.57983  ORF Transcript_42444/g.57983 Transcript_42444/m.57983 type:complete len:426 (+) Transcript_42444:50-1327(+)|eukprot:CAMPEP_0185769082 /NCGR_PEP_ID=MMETSP1174-20130828/53357_1 /TAXON_ID=35687 /ORGANISM="Dictyocha speculum, Strain CCMP1381" /LENGTH=425 /DNA_ID=CAMNT_0028454033 /DNA_START=50 /DNA_END=1327 /DNA_ORIENTATION=-
MTARIASILCVLGLLASPLEADRVDELSFGAPFDYVDSSGTRLPSSQWKNGGVTDVSKSFIRLTPDRQSKKGAIWSRKAVGVDTFSSVFKFRISGQGKNFFGDGMALWFIQQAYYVEGDLHGSVERFKGFGIIFDTFKNTETLSYHRDISIVVNDGEKTTEMMMDKVEGCDASIRYHEARADFSVVDSASRIKVQIENGVDLVLTVDGQNDGDFEECARVTLPFAQDWLAKAHIGVTASTGQLADNHDVISLSTYTDLELHDHHQMLQLTAPKFETGSGINEGRFERLENMVNTLLSKLDYLEHHTEHELMAVEDHMKVTVTKLKQSEAISEGRLDELEDKVSGRIADGMESRLAQLENSLDESLVHRLTAVEGVLNNKISATVQSLPGVGGWKLPFLFLFLMFVGGAVGLYQWYKIMLKKSHLP